MKKVITILIALLIFTGCDSSEETKIDKKKSEAKLKAAYKAFSTTVKAIEEKNGVEEARDMDVFDFRVSYELCAEAVEADPSNLDAQVCAAVTRILTLFKDPNFVLLRDSWIFIDHFDLDSTSANSNRFKITKFIDESLLPAIDYSLERLAVVDKAENKDYVFLITPELHGNEEEDDYEADMTEIKLFNSILMAIKSGINITQAYKIEIADYSLEGIKTALNKGSDFLTLKNAQKMKDAMAQARLSVNKSIEAVDFLLTETDDQENDLLRNTEKTLDMINDAKDWMLKIKDALNNPYSYTNNEVTFVMNLTRFFNNPVQDFKALLPDYTVSIKNNKLKLKVADENPKDVVFPDTTLGGLLDGPISQDDFKYFTNMYNCGRGNLTCNSDSHCSEDLRCDWGAVCENNDDTMCSEWDHCSDENYCKNGKRCPNGDSDCGDWDHCSPENICEYGKRCPEGNECESYEVCSDDHICVYED